MLAYMSYFLLKKGRHLVSFPPRVLVLHSMPFGGTVSYVPLATHSTQKEMEIKLGLESVLEERKPYSNRHLRKWPV